MGNPRHESNLGTMLCFHNRYRLGDGPVGLNPRSFSGWSDLEAYLREAKQALIILPLYLYDHSGLRMKVGSFQGLLPGGHAEFDSGQVGFIYITKAKIKSEYPGKLIRARLLAKVEGILREEVAEYDRFLTSGEED